MVSGEDESVSPLVCPIEGCDRKTPLAVGTYCPRCGWQKQSPADRTHPPPRHDDKLRNALFDGDMAQAAMIAKTQLPVFRIPGRLDPIGCVRRPNFWFIDCSITRVVGKTTFALPDALSDLVGIITMDLFDRSTFMDPYVIDFSSNVSHLHQFLRFVHASGIVIRPTETLSGFYDYWRGYNRPYLPALAEFLIEIGSLDPHRAVEDVEFFSTIMCMWGRINSRCVSYYEASAHIGDGGLMRKAMDRGIASARLSALAVRHALGGLLLPPLQRIVVGYVGFRIP